MTTLEEEDDLFGAHLSMDFEDDVQKNRPWQSATRRNQNNYTQTQYTSDVLYREPYELLDDVPPANIPSQANLIKPRYPVDDLYPQADGIGSESGKRNARPRVTFRLDNDSSPYPIDDYSDVEVMSNNSYSSKLAYDDAYGRYDNADNNSISESRSDSEMSTYQSINENDYSPRDGNEYRYHYDDGYGSSAPSPGRNEMSRYEYDNNSYDSEESDFDSTSGGGRSRSSMSTFERFYHDGDDEGITDSPGTYMSERSAGMIAPEIADKESRAQNDSFDLASTTDRSPDEKVTYRETKVDGSAPTPLRSNARKNETSSAQRGENDEIFRIHGADSFLSSKSGGISAGISSSGDASSPNPSHHSDDSAVQHLADFHKSRQPNNLDSPRHIFDVEPHPTAHLINGFRRRDDPPEEKAAKREVHGSGGNGQEPDGYQFGLFPDILRDDYPVETRERLHDHEAKPCGQHNLLDRVTEERPQERYEDANGHGYNEREPVGECYNEIKHKLVQFDDVYEEDVVGEDRHQKNCDFDFATDVSLSSSTPSSHEKQKKHVADDVSVISEDTDIRRLATQHALRNNEKRARCINTYSVKPKDSMESGIKINAGRRNNQDTDKKIMRSDSMESYMNNDSLQGKVVEQYYHSDMQSAASVVSPPSIKRKEFNFANMKRSYSEESSDDPSRFESRATEALYSSDGDSQASSDGDSQASSDGDSQASSDDASMGYSSEDESEASDDPSLFPSKAIYQMNLDHNHAKAGGSDISGDLIEKACGLLSRGRNSDALDALTIAFNRAENNMNHAKQLLDEHYMSKKRGSNTHPMDEEAFEDRLDTNFQRAASEMADISNNIGVVHEMNGDLQKAMNSFREALTVYRDMCHRYENTGDSDVDRTVSNIMQMGIAMRSQQRRLELHSTAQKLETKIHSSNDPSTRLKMRMERLNVLMCAIDIERESLGRNHPSVGHTLMKKGNLSLELGHIGEAIKDCREAIEILKKGLGPIHPEIGFSLIQLADIFNYHSNGDLESDKETALSLYQSSLVPLQESFGRVNSDLALAYNSIGIIYAMKSDTKNAMKSFYDALVGYGVKMRADEESSSGPVCPDVFFVWLNVGDLHSKRNEWQLALRSFQKACNSFRALSDSQKDYLQGIGPRRMMRFATSKSGKPFDDNETLLSSVLQHIGKAQCMLHKYGKSVESYQEALRIQKIIVMRCENVGTNSTRDVARALGNLGEAQMLSGDLSSSLQTYTQSLNILRSSGCDDESFEVALVLGKIGQLHLKKGCYVEAAVTLQHCMRIFEITGVPVDNHRIKEIRSFLVDAELALIQNKTSTLAGQGRDTSNVRYDDRAVAIDEIADMYKNKGDYSGAIWFYTEALDLRRKKAQQLSGARNNAYACEIVDVARTICNIAQMRTQRREFEAASILFDEAKHIYHTVGLPKDHPFNKDLLRSMSQMRKM